MKDALQKAHQRKFYGVALALIIAGSGIFIVGVIQTLLQSLASWEFGWPFGKVMGGLLVIGVGYIVLQLEIIRQQQFSKAVPDEQK